MTRFAKTDHIIGILCNSLTFQTHQLYLQLFRHSDMFKCLKEIWRKIATIERECALIRTSAFLFFSEFDNEPWLFLKLLVCVDTTKCSDSKVEACKLQRFSQNGSQI